MAGWSDELSGGVMARCLLDTPIVFFRDNAGKPRALHDRCPHRFAPLSKGMITTGALTCGYHGLAFGGDGACVSNPHGPIVKAMKVDSYPVREMYRAIWVWLGDPELATKHDLPDLSFLSEAPDSAFSSGHLLSKGNYQLYVDNILDLTHADFLHPTTLGGGSLTRTKPEIYEDGDKVSIQWHAFNETPSPLQSRQLPKDCVQVDSWMEVTWQPPATMVLLSGAVPTGTPRASGGNMLNTHIMTPESPGVTHYFFAATRDFALHDVELNEQISKMRAEIFGNEDSPMITAQYDRMEGAEFWSLKPLLLPIDKGAVLVRRVLERLITAEHKIGKTAAQESTLAK